MGMGLGQIVLTPRGLYTPTHSVKKTWLAHIIIPLTSKETPPINRGMEKAPEQPEEEDGQAHGVQAVRIACSRKPYIIQNVRLGIPRFVHRKRFTPS